MSKATQNLQEALAHAMSIRPEIGGFPTLAEALRKAGITKNIWNLPSCQSIYITKFGPVVTQGVSLVNAPVDIPPFNKEALVKALRIDQAGKSSFPEFLKASWESGVVSYVVDFKKRQVTYYGVLDESYSEEYPVVQIALKSR